MAFDQPLEADRVENLGLVSSFVRAPVLGTIMWILGGSLGQEEEDSTDDKPQLQTLDDDRRSKGGGDGNGNGSGSGGGDRDGNGTNDFLDARLAKEDSKEENITSREHHREQRIPDRKNGEGICSVEDETKRMSLNSDTAPSTAQGSSDKTKQYQRKTSWNDEIGKSLVEYMDDSNPVKPSSSSSSNSSLSSTNNAPKPIKSAMRRSRSTRSNNPVGQTIRFNTPQCMPKMSLNNSNHGGIIMPTRPGAGGPSCAANGNGGGHVSPEWGFYCSLTPPTPEMYSSGQASSPMKKTDAAASGAVVDGGAASSTTSPVQGPYGLQPVFPKTPKYVGKPTMGWPSVPL